MAIRYSAPRRFVVLDATELARDWMCRGAGYLLVPTLSEQTSVSFVVPASVIEEVTAGYARAVHEYRTKADRLTTDGRRLGFVVSHEPTVGADDYSEYLRDRLFESLGIGTLPWPAISHAELVGRAAHRVAPFDSKGGGYRDSLVWAALMEAGVAAVHQGGEIQMMLASADRAFAGADGELLPDLVAEASTRGFTASLIRELPKWILANLPTDASDLSAALQAQRDQDFLTYFLQSDLQDDLTPSPEDLGLRARAVEVQEVTWDGLIRTVRVHRPSESEVVTEYELGQDVTFEARFLATDNGWDEAVADFRGEVVVDGEVSMIVRIAVLFDADLDFSIEQVEWRRADGTEADAAAAPQTPDTPLF